METRRSSVIVLRAPAAAAVTDAKDGAMMFPDEFLTDPKPSLFCRAYASSTYPIEYSLFLTSPATPALPCPPRPVGQLTEFA